MGFVILQNIKEKPDKEMKMKRGLIYTAIFSILLIFSAVISFEYDSYIHKLEQEQLAYSNRLQIDELINNIDSIVESNIKRSPYLSVRRVELKVFYYNMFNSESFIEQRKTAMALTLTPDDILVQIKLIEDQSFIKRVKMLASKYSKLTKEIIVNEGFCQKFLKECQE